eukprot:TRINITY_DN144_c0_g1_i4.p1 TRINITY_DN144_c0_g1~~TRINITY_DN144_c0_g1_i4.p1  ORF type:complete len:243 (-),score=51.53 TRINITY_DN144_c0_g1_i4:204-932(-)
MVLTIRNVNVKKSKSAMYIRRGLFAGGLVVVVIGLAAAIYELFTLTEWVIAGYSAVFATYTVTMFVIASVSLHLSRNIWCGSSRDETKAKREFSRKVKVMIGWIVTGLLQMCVGLTFNILHSPLSEVFFISFVCYNMFDLTLAILSLLFNQHYVYPFAGFNCCSGGPESSSSTNKPSSSRFSIASKTPPSNNNVTSASTLTPPPEESEELFKETQQSCPSAVGSEVLSECASIQSASTSTQS